MKRILSEDTITHIVSTQVWPTLKTTPIDVNNDLFTEDLAWPDPHIFTQ